jgi:hypothetical protein
MFVSDTGIDDHRHPESRSAYGAGGGNNLRNLMNRTASP